MPIIMIVSAFAALVASGGAPRASICDGARATATRPKRLLGGCFSLQIRDFADADGGAAAVGAANLLLAFGASENTIDYADNYMNIYAFGTLFVQLTLGMNAFITAQGFADDGHADRAYRRGVQHRARPDLHLRPEHGRPRRGAGDRYFAGRVLRLGRAAFLMGKKTMLRLKAQNIRIDLKLLCPVHRARHCPRSSCRHSESIISVCFNSSLLKYGGDIAVGAMTILTSVMQFAMLPLQGLGAGRAADLQLQLRREKRRARPADLPRCF